MDRLSNYRTLWDTCGDTGGVSYVRTRIVEWDADTITLRTGGWRTVTTKRKMNQAARQFGLGYSVFQHDFDWFIRRPDGGDMPFDKDEITFSRRKAKVA